MWTSSSSAAPSRGAATATAEGPINRIVDDALAADILWINAAGNYGRRVYNGPVRVLPDGYLRLRDGPDIAALRFRNRVDENTVTVTLTWNDYRDEEDAGTDKDLDLYVEDWAGRRVGPRRRSRSRARVPRPGRDPQPPRARRPDRPRRRPRRPLRPRLQLSHPHPGEEGPLHRPDRIRVLVTASRDATSAGGRRPREAVEFLDATGEGELYPPADHPLVLTVGDADPASSIGPTADARVKPDVLLEDSRAFFTDGQVSAGSSNAAAYVAGVVAVLKAAEPGLRTRHLLLLASRGPTAPLPDPAPT